MREETQQEAKAQTMLMAIWALRLAWRLEPRHRDRDRGLRSSL